MWDLILHCWKAKPSERPGMDLIAKRIPARVQFRWLSTDLNKVCCIALSRYTTTDSYQSMNPGGSVVSKVTVDRICKLLNMPEHDINDITASELRTTSDVELFLEVLLDVGMVLFC